MALQALYPEKHTCPTPVWPDHSQGGSFVAIFLNGSVWFSQNGAHQPLCFFHWEKPHSKLGAQCASE